MKQFTSDVVCINTTVKKFEKNIVDLEKIYDEVKKILPPKTLDAAKVESIDHHKAVLSTKLGKVTVERKNYDQEKHEIQYGIDAPGFKKINLWVQAIPKDENYIKARLVLGYDFSLSPIGLMARGLIKEENIGNSLSHIMGEIKNKLEEGI